MTAISFGTSHPIRGVMWLALSFLVACANERNLSSQQGRPVRSAEQHVDARIVTGRFENSTRVLGTGGGGDVYQGPPRFGKDLFAAVGLPLRPGEKNWPLDVKSSVASSVTWIVGGRSLDLGSALKCSYRSSVTGGLPRTVNVWLGSRPGLTQLSEKEIQGLAFRKLLQDVALTECPPTWGAMVSSVWGGDAWGRLEARESQRVADEKVAAIAHEERNRNAIRLEMDKKEQASKLSGSEFLVKPSGGVVGKLPSDGDIRDAVVQAWVDGWRFSREESDILSGEGTAGIDWVRFRVIIEKSECEFKNGHYRCIYLQTLERMPSSKDFLSAFVAMKLRDVISEFNFGQKKTFGEYFYWKEGRLLSKGLTVKLNKEREAVEIALKIDAEENERKRSRQEKCRYIYGPYTSCY